MSTNQLDLWKTEGEVSIEEMDAAVKELRAAKDRKSEAQAVLTEANLSYSDAQDKVMSLMKHAGKETYIAEGFGRVTLKEYMSVRTPKSPEEKQAFFSWIRENMGDDAYYAYMSVNSASLNRLYKEKVEEFGDRGEVLNIDGIGDPTSYTQLSFTKS